MRTRGHAKGHAEGGRARAMSAGLVCIAFSRPAHEIVVAYLGQPHLLAQAGDVGGERAFRTDLDKLVLLAVLAAAPDVVPIRVLVPEQVVPDFGVAHP